MKTTAILSIIFYFVMTNGIKNDFISITYVGSADAKPLPVIYISKKMLPRSEQTLDVEYDDLPQDYVVYNSEYLSLKRLINSTPKKPHDVSDENGFIFKLRENNSIDSCFIKRKDANIFFMKADSILLYKKGNNRLIYQLNCIRLRNVF